MELGNILQDLEKKLSSLKVTKQELQNMILPTQEKPATEISSHYSYIHPLVEDIHVLELKEKELKEKYHNKVLLAEAQQFGQRLLSESFGNGETVLKCWHTELKEMHSSQPAISTTSVESQDIGTVHNIVYDCTYDWKNIREMLAVTVLYQAVHCRIKIHSVSPCSNIHFFSSSLAEISVDSDNHIPDLEETILKLLERSHPIKSLISKISDYMASDMAPFVISIPMRKKTKKKKKESTIANSLDNQKLLQLQD